MTGEYPPRADLRKMMAQQSVPVIAPGTVDLASMAGEEPTTLALAVLSTFNAALAADDAKALESCFLADQAYWKDQLALTYHLRTFTTPRVIAAGLLETKKLRGVTGEVKLEGSAQFIPATPALVSEQETTTQEMQLTPFHIHSNSLTVVLVSGLAHQLLRAAGGSCSCLPKAMTQSSGRSGF